MKIDKIINEIVEYAIEFISLVMLCIILYIAFVFLYAYFDVPMY